MNRINMATASGALQRELKPNPPTHPPTTQEQGYVEKQHHLNPVRAVP